MELTVDQMLQQGVAAHNANNLQEAERFYRAILQVQPKHPDANHNLGLIAVSMNQSGAALPLFKRAIDVNPNREQFWLSYIDALITERQFDNAKRAIKKGKKKGVAKEKLKTLTRKLASVKVGNILVEAPSQVEIQKLINHYQNGLYGDAENLAILLTQQFPSHSFSWKILGAIYKALGRMTDAIGAGKKAVELEPRDNEAHNSLGITLKEMGRLEEAEVSYRQAIALKPDYAEAQGNLGDTLQELGRLEEAEVSLRRAIALKSDFNEAHNNLGITQQKLGRLEEAEASYRQAIALKYDYAQAHSNLGIILYISGDTDSGIESLQKAKNIDSNLDSNNIVLTILQARKARGKTEVSANNISNPGYGADQFSPPFFANRVAEAELITNLYEMNSRKLDVTPDTRYGNGRCSPDYKMFEDDRSVIKTVARDLISIMKLAVKSDVFVVDSFFNIYEVGCGITPHTHLMSLDTSKGLNLAKQKYSLVYYLAVGDQNCSEPGILRFYDPDEEFLPSEGMIAIFPADRKHSAVYGGEKDRVMIGVNFYSL